VRRANQRWVSFVILLCAGFCAAPYLGAQVPDSLPLPYPGWIAADRVEPTIIVDEGYDTATATWAYNYTVANGLTAEQDIKRVTLRLDAWTSGSEVPDGWWVFAADEEAFIGAGSNSATVIFRATLPNGTLQEDRWPPSEFQIPPGASLSGFVTESLYPSGYARTYTQGHSGSLFPPTGADDLEAYYARNPTPRDTTDSQRGWTLAPTIYREVVTGGNRRPAIDGFLGFMNLAEKGSVLIDPAPIAFKFALNGETVDRETLEVKLNGVDVTAAFLPGPADGADLVGVFRIGSSPLQDGKNVLLTSVEGLVPGTSRTAKDTDRITFNVITDWDGSLTSYALGNLPWPEPGWE